jgi:ligand-binding sensor protein
MHIEKGEPDNRIPLFVENHFLGFVNPGILKYVND